MAGYGGLGGETQPRTTPRRTVAPVIVGARTEAQLRDNLGAVEGRSRRSRSPSSTP